MQQIVGTVFPQRDTQGEADAASGAINPIPTALECHGPGSHAAGERLQWILPELAWLLCIPPSSARVSGSWGPFLFASPLFAMSPSPVVRARRHKARSGVEPVRPGAHPPPADAVQASLRIVGLGGLLCTVSVNLAATVAEAQKLIAKTAGVPVCEQHLISHDRRLFANEVLGDALGKDSEVTLLRCDAKAMAIKSAMRTGSLALERARRLTMQCVSDA